MDRLIDARWTDEIHGEWFGNLVAGGPSPSNLCRKRSG
jgi:hypothetical protein